jgi:5-methylcytosine-specific restriction endonuclease McrA
VKRAGIRPGAKSVQRGSTFKRKRRTGAAARHYRPETAAFREAAHAQGACMNPRCPRPDGRWTAHHVVYRQHLIAEGHLDLYPPADAMRLCHDCHANYHARSLRLPADVLPPAAVAFARALLGAERAIDYLGRYYPAL